MMFWQEWRCTNNQQGLAPRREILVTEIDNIYLVIIIIIIVAAMIMMITRSIGRASESASSKNAPWSCTCLFNEDIDDDHCHRYDDHCDLDGDKDEVIELQ